MGSSKKQTVGYRYFIGLHMGFCHGPVDSLRELRVSDKLAWPTGNDTGPTSIPLDSQAQWDLAVGMGVVLRNRPPGSPTGMPAVMTGIASASGKIYINNPNLFGGEEREGGVAGYVNVHLGGPAEPQDTYLAKVLGPQVPAFRGVFNIVAEQCYVAAMNPYIKPWSAYATRIFSQTDGGSQWYPAKAAINSLDMNPAHILYELLTNRVYGRGRDPSELDIAAFIAAADRLYEEGFGLSVLWADTRNLDGFVQTICAHIDGSLFQDRVTNKWKLKLARNDYTVSALPIFNEDNILQVDELGRPMPSELTNQVTLTYWNRVTRKNDTIVLDNQALQDAIGGQINPNDIDRTAISGTALAQRVASRELRTLSTSLLTGRMTVNRDGMQLERSSVFRFRLPSRGITEVVCRVTGINYGSKENEAIIVSFIEDIFALPDSTYLAPNPTLWDDPRKLPSLSPYRYLGEIPYYTLIQQIGAPAYSSLPATSSAVVVSGSRQSAATYDMTAWTRQGGAQYAERGKFAACAVARVPAFTGRAETSTVLVDQVVDPQEIYYNTYAIWDSELVLVKDYIHATSTLVLARGVLDTTPQEHLANSRILFIQDHQFMDETVYNLSETINAKITTRTNLGELALSAAPVDSYTFAARHTRPYAPARFRVNALLYPTDIYGEAITLTWSHRNRLQQTAYIVEQGEANIGPEAGTTYTVRVKNGATVVQSYTGISVTNWSYTTADQRAHGVLQDLSFEVLAVRDTYNSWQSQTSTVARHGYGFQYGLEYGGVSA